MIASHFVIKEILDKWENKKELEREFGKFSERYLDDEELQVVYKKFKTALMKEKRNMEQVKKKLEELYNERTIEVAGNVDTLPYADRRHF